jgi:hypothetical protein
MELVRVKELGKRKIGLSYLGQLGVARQSERLVESRFGLFYSFKINIK